MQTRLMPARHRSGNQRQVLLENDHPIAQQGQLSTHVILVCSLRVAKRKPGGGSRPSRRREVWGLPIPLSAAIITTFAWENQKV